MKLVKKSLKVFFIIFIVVILSLSKYFCKESIAEEQDVKISIFKKPKIDIVLAKSRTKTDLNNFRSEIQKSLQKYNIDASDVEIKDIGVEKIEHAEKLEWKRDSNDDIGKITIDSTGKNVQFVGNQTLPGKNAIYIMPEGNKEQKFNFSYNIEVE